jgi:glucokinase
VDENHAIGIDIGGTLIKTVAVSSEGDVLYRDILETRDYSVPNESEDPGSFNVQHWVMSIDEQIKKIREILKCKISCIGIAAPGIVDKSGDYIACMPGRLKGLEGLIWSERLDCDCRVTVLNDAQAALLGEVWIGSATGYQNVVMVTLGTGVGGAVMMEGRLLKGKIGRAGHIGHICLDPRGVQSICRVPGGLEWFVGDYSLGIRSEGKYSSTKELVEDYRRGEKYAVSLWLDTVRVLACGIVSAINMMDPEAVVLGGGLTAAKEALFEPLKEFLDKFEWRPMDSKVEILQASLGEHGGAIGAARNSLQDCPA